MVSLGIFNPDTFKRPDLCKLIDSEVKEQEPLPSHWGFVGVGSRWVVPTVTELKDAGRMAHAKSSKAPRTGATVSTLNPTDRLMQRMYPTEADQVAEISPFQAYWVIRTMDTLADFQPTPGLSVAH